jgi:hypothetical protein
MKMTRQHFQAQADLCADILINLSHSVALTLGHIDDVIESFCDMCERTNPAFDRQRFRGWVLNKLELS